jgi:hypothetical protein
MPVDAAEEIVAEAQRKGDLIGVRMSVADGEDAQDPWTLPPSRKRKERPIEGPLPKTVQIVRANLVYVESKDLPPAMLNRLLRLAAFQNPEFYKAQAMRLSTYDKPRVIACARRTSPACRIHSRTQFPVSSIFCGGNGVSEKPPWFSTGIIFSDFRTTCTESEGRCYPICR